MMKSKVVVFFYIVFMFFTISSSVEAYSNSQYSIEIPTTYTNISEGSFLKENGTSISIQTEEYDVSELGVNILETDIYTEETLNELAKGIEEEIYTYISSGIFNSIKNYYPEITDKDIEDIKKYVTYNFAEINIIEISDYKAFKVKFKINLADEIDYIFEEYLIYTENFITVIGVGTLDETYFDTVEYTNIIDSLVINDERLPTQIDSYMVFESYKEYPIILLIDLVATVFIYCIIPVILRIARGKYEYYKGRKILIINSVVAYFIVISLQELQNIEMSNGFSAILYYYINKSILLKKKENNNIEKTNLEMKCQVCGKEIEENENGTCEECHNLILKRIEEKNNMKNYCTKCGNDVEESWEFCNYCGFKLK